MSDYDDLKAKLTQKSDESAARADILLADELNTLKAATFTDLERLRPKITDQETYNKLIAVIDEETQNNLDIASLKDKLAQLGSVGIQVAKTAAALLK